MGAAIVYYGVTRKGQSNETARGVPYLFGLSLGLSLSTFDLYNFLTFTSFPLTICHSGWGPKRCKKDIPALSDLYGVLSTRGTSRHSE